MNVSVIGNICLDLIVKAKKLPYGEEDLPAEITLHIGGNAANSSIVLSKLGVKTTLYSKIGQDVFADYIMNKLNNGIVSKIIKSNQTPITLCFVKSDERSFLYDIGTTRTFTKDNLDQEEILNSDAIFVTGYSYLPNLNVTELFQKAREKGILTFFDPCSGRQVSEELKHTDVLFVNHEELKTISINDVKIVVVKKGSDGCTVIENGKESDFKGVPVEVVDTTGAGDAFNAGFIYKYLKTKKLYQSAEFANKAGAIATTKSGIANIDWEKYVNL